jgi:hypothetical protein
MSEIINETIKQIPNYSQNFVDVEGNIFKKQKDGSLKKLTPRDDHRGYLIIPCKRDSTGKNYPLKVHHAVLTAFVGAKPFPTSIARHLDDDSFNNRLTNLAWGTHGENQSDKIKNKTKKNLVDKRKPTKEKQDILKRMAHDGYTVAEMSLITGWNPKLVQNYI